MNIIWEDGYEAGYRAGFHGKIQIPQKYRISTEDEDEYRRGFYVGQQDFRREKE